MISRSEYIQARERAVHQLRETGVVLRPDETERIEVADFGLSDLGRYGLQLLTYVNTERCCAKELVLYPRQTCPEHRHPPIPSLNYPGKEETFRCRSGRVYLYLPGPAPDRIAATIVPGDEKYFTVFDEYILEPGDQVIIPPDTLHWFQGGDEGAVVTEFSTRSLDEYDVFTDPRVQRAPQVGG